MPFIIKCVLEFEKPLNASRDQRHGWIYCRDNAILPDEGKRRVTAGSSGDPVEFCDWRLV